MAVSLFTACDVLDQINDALINNKSPNQDSSDPQANKSEQQAIANNELSFKLIDDKSSYSVSGIGKCKDTDIAIPDSVTHIGEYAFDGCTNLTFAVIGSKVTDIGYAIFLDCDMLTDIYCKISSQPPEWNIDRILFCQASVVHWGDEWEYVNGVPTLK